MINKMTNLDCNKYLRVKSFEILLSNIPTVTANEKRKPVSGKKVDGNNTAYIAYNKGKVARTSQPIFRGKKNPNIKEPPNPRREIINPIRSF
tara:strand:+ start:214 stop:489 length:276 start_codon:yes stop_codon:yes gene_type:complete